MSKDTLYLVFIPKDDFAQAYERVVAWTHDEAEAEVLIKEWEAKEPRAQLYRIAEGDESWRPMHCCSNCGALHVGFYGMCDYCDEAHMEALREVTRLPIPEKQVETPDGWAG